jgi:IclR family pca regulon transcriptional regulator
LAPKALSLGFNYLNQLPLAQIAQPVLKALAEEAQAATHLVVLDGHDAVHIARVTPAALIVSNLQLGTRRPAHLVPSGRMLLAHMSEDELIQFHHGMKVQRLSAATLTLKSFLAMTDADRRRGYAYSKTVHESNLMSCASAVLDFSGAAVAAVAVIGPRGHMESVLGENLLATLVKKAANGLSAKLGYKATGRAVRSLSSSSR